MRIYLIRHGDPDYANDTITAEGEHEAAALAERLSGEGLTHLYASPMGRAQATAAPTAGLTGLAVETLPWTEEWGDLQLATRHGRRSIWDLDGEELRVGDLAQQPHRWHELPPLDDAGLARRWTALQAGSDALLAAHGYQRHDARYAVEPGSRDRIAVFCHGGFGLAWLAWLLGVPLHVMWAGFWLPPTSVSTILLDERSAEWAVPRALWVGETSHLAVAGRAPLPRGIKANFD